METNNYLPSRLFNRLTSVSPNREIKRSCQFFGVAMMAILALNCQPEDKVIKGDIGGENTSVTTDESSDDEVYEEEFCLVKTKINVTRQTIDWENLNDATVFPQIDAIDENDQRIGIVATNCLSPTGSSGAIDSQKAPALYSGIRLRAAVHQVSQLDPFCAIPEEELVCREKVVVLEPEPSGTSAETGNDEGTGGSAE